MTKKIFIPLAVVVVVVASVAAFAGRDDSSSADAWRATRAEVEEMSKEARTAGSQEQLVEILGRIEDRLLTFRNAYRKSPEALDAAFELGSLMYSKGMLMQDPSAYAQAVSFLSEYVLKSSGNRQNLAAAHFYLAESYKANNKFDEARHEYKLVIDEFGDVNPRIKQLAQTNLADFDVQQKLAVGNEPLGFEVKSITGDPLSPARYKGKVLLIDFWATWCGPCRAEMPNVKRIYSKYKNRGFEIMGISLDKSRRDLDRYLASNSITWPQYFDGKYWNNDIATQYGVRSIPTTYLIDRKGKIRFKSLRGAQLEKAVAKLVGEEG